MGTTFCENAQETLQSTKKLATQLVQDYDACVGFFAENEKITFKELTNAMNLYFQQFEKAIADNFAFDQQKKKKQELEELIAQTKEERGILDSALGTLRSRSSL